MKSLCYISPVFNSSSSSLERVYFNVSGCRLGRSVQRGNKAQVRQAARHVPAALHAGEVRFRGGIRPIRWFRLRTDAHQKHLLTNNA